MERLTNNQPQDTFTTSAYVRIAGQTDNSILYARVSYTTIPQYKVFRRVLDWWYHHNDNEAITERDFLYEFGDQTGNELCQKWKAYGCDLFKMLECLYRDTEKGQKFLTIMMEHVGQYEKRIYQAV